MTTLLSVLVFIPVCVLCFFIDRLYLKWKLNRAKTAILVPDLQSAGYVFRSFKLLYNPSLPFHKDLGDFKGIPVPLFNAKHNRKVYGYLYYENPQGGLFRCTVKIWMKFWGPVKVTYKPLLSEGQAMSGYAIP